MTPTRRGLLRGIGAILAGAAVGLPAVAEAAGGPPALVLRDGVRGCDMMPPGGSYETHRGLGVLIRFLVVSPVLSLDEATEIGRLVRRIGASEQASLSSLQRLLPLAWEAHWSKVSTRQADSEGDG